MKGFLKSLCLSFVGSLVLFGCGGGSGGDETIDLREFIFPSASMTYTEEEYLYVDGVGGLDNISTRQEELIDGRLVSTDSLSSDIFTAEIIDDEIVISNNTDESVTRFPTQVGVGQSVENTFVINNFPATTTFTFQVLPAFAISTPDQTFTTFNDVLQVNINTEFTEIEGAVNSSIAYFARGLGGIGGLDRNCINANGVAIDSSTVCDVVTELYSVRVN